MLFWPCGGEHASASPFSDATLAEEVNRAAAASLQRYCADSGTFSGALDLSSLISFRRALLLGRNGSSAGSGSGDGGGGDGGDDKVARTEDVVVWDVRVANNGNGSKGSKGAKGAKGAKGGTPAATAESGTVPARAFVDPRGRMDWTHALRGDPSDDDQQPTSVGHDAIVLGSRQLPGTDRCQLYLRGCSKEEIRGMVVHCTSKSYGAANQIGPVLDNPYTYAQVSGDAMMEMEISNLNEVRIHVAARSRSLSLTLIFPSPRPPAGLR